MLKNPSFISLIAALSGLALVGPAQAQLSEPNLNGTLSVPAATVPLHMARGDAHDFSIRTDDRAQHQQRRICRGQADQQHDGERRTAL